MGGKINSLNIGPMNVLGTNNQILAPYVQSSTAS